MSNMRDKGITEDASYESSETENNLHELSEAMLVARIEDWISQQ